MLATASNPAPKAAGLCDSRLTIGTSTTLTNSSPVCATFLRLASNLSYGLAAASASALNFFSPSSSTALAKA